MKPLVLIGGGGHCRACIDVIEQQAAYSIHGVIDPDLKAHETVLGYPVLGGDGHLPSVLSSAPNAFVAVGQVSRSRLRQNLYDRLKELGFKRPFFISPHAYVARDVTLGSGSIVMHGAVVNRGAVVGENCIINSQALIEHDAQIGNHCHIATGAIVNGGARLGNGVFLGSNALVVQNASVAGHTFIKANTLVQ